MPKSIEQTIVETLQRHGIRWAHGDVVDAFSAEGDILIGELAGLVRAASHQPNPVVQRVLDLRKAGQDTRVELDREEAAAALDEVGHLTFALGDLIARVWRLPASQRALVFGDWPPAVSEPEPEPLASEPEVGGAPLAAVVAENPSWRECVENAIAQLVDLCQAGILEDYRIDDALVRLRAALAVSGEPDAIWAFRVRHMAGVARKAADGSSADYEHVALVELLDAIEGENAPSDPVAALVADVKGEGSQVCLLVLGGGIVPPVDVVGFRAGGKVATLADVARVAAHATRPSAPSA